MAKPGRIEIPVRLVADAPMAWRHHCGQLNEGAWRPGEGCSACGTSVEHAADVEARYLLVELAV